ncbi:hypothetical protein LZ198_40965 [Myxococcus sp. K15C18031901]|uniref:hypothetical protein n=1 Tax=Myxococcus dinghuensis TaxID=2906761 RepID=UPI0020A814F6|nr:hypothetical protein [Myxococcus dinghuensis]MCP3105259.1 hypothetical protein [Myxococcus dinghuensis]
MKLRFLMVLLLVGCGSSDPVDPQGPPDPQELEKQADDARILFDEIFKAAEYERIPEVRAALKAVYDQDSSVNDGDVAMLLGVTYLWNTAEWERDPSRGTEARRQEVLKGEEYLTRAKELRPTDGRVYCWLGIMKAFRSQVELNLALYQESIDLIDQGIELFPQFSHLVVAFVKSGWAANSTEFAGAIEHIWKNVDVCIEGAIDRQNPDFTQYMHLMSNTGGQRRACWSSDLVPHNLEGFWFHMGDLLVKNNQPDLAVTAYENAKLLPTYSTWTYAEEMETRQTNAHENAAKYRDSDTKNDPPLLPQTTFQCTVCHQK